MKNGLTGRRLVGGLGRLLAMMLIGVCGCGNLALLPGVCGSAECIDDRPLKPGIYRGQEECSGSLFVTDEDTVSLDETGPANFVIAQNGRPLFDGLAPAIGVSSDELRVGAVTIRRQITCITCGDGFFVIHYDAELLIANAETLLTGNAQTRYIMIGDNQIQISDRIDMGAVDGGIVTSLSFTCEIIGFLP